MSGLKGNIQSLAKFSSNLRALPRVVGQKVAAAAAPALTDVANGTFAAGENAYGATWEPKKDGSKATLDVTGGIKRGIYYVAIGTVLRVRLAVDYARYQVGRRPVFPTQGSALPTSYVNALVASTSEVITAEARAA